jgi:hypothetical protein
MVKANDIAGDLVGKYVDVYAFPDGRIEVRYTGYALLYRMFGKERRVAYAAITENKRLGDVRSWIKSQQDEMPASRRRRTASARTTRSGPQAREVDFMNDPIVRRAPLTMGLPIEMAMSLAAAAADTPGLATAQTTVPVASKLVMVPTASSRAAALRDLPQSPTGLRAVTAFAGFRYRR